MHSHFTVIYDACVLYPAMLRNLLMQLTTTEMFRARWTEQIHEEWIRNLLEQRPDLEREQLERTRALMDRVAPDCLVTGHEPLVEGLELPDPDDRHVLAAAIRCNADAIITMNLKDFPEETLAPYGIEAQHPDEFLSHLLDLNDAEVCASVRVVRARLRNPPIEAGELIDSIQALGLPETATRLREYMQLL